MPRRVDLDCSYEEFLNRRKRGRSVHEVGDLLGLLLVDPGCDIDENETTYEIGCVAAQSERSQTPERHSHDCAGVRRKRTYHRRDVGGVLLEGKCSRVERRRRIAVSVTGKVDAQHRLRERECDRVPCVGVLSTTVQKNNRGFGGAPLQ
jgi:hypothetical protein